MKRVTGIGGIFFKAKDAPTLRAWYQRHLGMDVQDWGGVVFQGNEGNAEAGSGTTIWSISADDEDYFAPSQAPFMINYRVADVRALVTVLKDEGCEVLDKVEESELGIFAWVIDPEGNKVELWQPPE